MNIVFINYENNLIDSECIKICEYHR